MRKILYLVALAVFFTACNEYDLNEILLGSSEVSLSLKGKVQYTFNPNKGQAAYNAEGTLYRFSDDDLNSWFELRCQSRPVNAEDRIKADLEWASKTSFGNEKNLEFVVKQTDDSGMIWLWNDTKNIGLIIRNFE